MVDSLHSQSMSQRVDGGLIIRKETLIVKNTKAIDEVYKRDKKVSFHYSRSKSSFYKLLRRTNVRTYSNFPKKSQYILLNSL